MRVTDSFSIIHALAYSFIGMQTLYLSTHFNSIYWNTACLIVNSGSLEDNSQEEIVDIYAKEKDDIANGITFEDLPDRKGKIKKTSSTDYTKMAKAIGDIQNSGVKLSLVSINNSDLGFKPDPQNNTILFGMKGLVNVGDDLIQTIIENRPYDSMEDFLAKVNINRQAMISLIKSGAFDEFNNNRKKNMVKYIWMTCDKKKNITLQNMPNLLKYEIVPDDYILEKRIYEFNKYLKAERKFKDGYSLDDRCIDFLSEIDCYEYADGEYLNAKVWDKLYQKFMDVIRSWISGNKQDILNKLNEKIFMEDWNKYAGKGNTSAWEMEVMCFYYGDHELKDVNVYKYGIADFSKLPEQPPIEKVYKKKDSEIPIYKLSKICGTCIAKDKLKSTVWLLTPSGVAGVKFNKEYFAMFDKRISEIGEDGKKHTLEKSWFDRGQMILVQGIRRDDYFIPKKYKGSGLEHQLYHIDGIDSDGDLVLRSERKTGIIEDGEN